MAYVRDDTIPNSGVYGSISDSIANAANRAISNAATPTGAIAAITAGAVGGANKITGKNNGGGGGGNNTPTQPTQVETGGYVGGNTFDMAAYLNAIRQEQMARAQAAYDRNMARIAESYGSAAGSLQSNYDSAVGRLNAARDKSMGDVRSDAEDSLRQAYINNMMTRKNLNQRLSALGYNGGATESTMSSLENQYGKSRTGINETLNKNISNLDMTYGDNLANALQAYNSAMANLNLQKMQMEMQAENALANAEASAMSGVMGIDGSYMSALQAALANQGAYQYDPSQATNAYVAGNAQQAQSTSDATNYQKLLAQARLMESQGNLTNQQLVQLTNGNAQTLAQILAALGR